jgi:hypothetical protein
MDVVEPAEELELEHTINVTLVGPLNEDII